MSVALRSGQAGGASGEAKTKLEDTAVMSVHTSHDFAPALVRVRSQWSCPALLGRTLPGGVER
jgi:hypothetical protein